MFKVIYEIDGSLCCSWFAEIFEEDGDLHLWMSGSDNYSDLVIVGLGKEICDELILEVAICDKLDIRRYAVNTRYEKYYVEGEGK